MAKKNAKDMAFEIEIPAEIEASVSGKAVIMKKDGKELRKIIGDKVKISKEGSKIILSAKKAKKDEKRAFGTARGHLKNMIDGLMKGFEYELEICNVHFPPTVTFDKAKSEFIVKNLLGEKHPRTLRVKRDVEIEVKAPKIKVRSYDLELAGQTAADIEKITRVRNRDRNKFQDGIFITKKPGAEYL